MCLAQGHNAVTPERQRPLGLVQALSHCAPFELHTNKQCKHSKGGVDVIMSKFSISDG